MFSECFAFKNKVAEGQKNFLSVCFPTSPCTVTVSIQSLRSQRLLDRMNSQYNVCLSRCTECVICTFHSYVFSCSCIYCFNIKSAADGCEVVQCGISVWSSQCVFVSAAYYKRKGLVLLLSRCAPFVQYVSYCHGCRFVLFPGLSITRFIHKLI